jgi:hypothetical protein
MSEQDRKYVDLLLAPIAKCATYKPKFGKGSKAASFEGFAALYGADPLYHWIGLDSDIMYAAHKAAGGMTSVYRQLGIGCERLFRQVLIDTLEIESDALKWSFEYERSKGKIGTRSLDARVRLDDIGNRRARTRFEKWLIQAAELLRLPKRRATELRGGVFEVRQGYKSADSKRQIGDMIFGSNAAIQDFLPVVAVVSQQASETVIRRYRAANMLVLLGSLGESEVESTFTFCETVVGYDLAAFFERNSKQLRREFVDILKGLLSP